MEEGVAMAMGTTGGEQTGDMSTDTQSQSMKAKKLQELREQLEKSKQQGEEDKQKLKSM